MPKKYNAQGKVYGFVCFRNIKKVGKLTKALNDVSFCMYQVFGKVARFDHFENSKEEVRGECVERQVIEGEKSMREWILHDGGEAHKIGKVTMEGRKVSEGEKR